MARGEMIRFYPQPDFEPDRPDQWMDEAHLHCREYVSRTGDDLWYSDKLADRIDAALMCATACPFQIQCLQKAVDDGEQWGIHGGLDFTRSHRHRDPSSCAEGHLLTSDNRLITNKRTGGERVQCKTCRRRDQERSRDRRAAALGGAA